jgi:hypothetical protein
MSTSLTLVLESPYSSARRFWESVGIRFACLVVVSFAALLGRPAIAQAEISLVGAWRHCEPAKGCLRFAFLPNGWVIEQFPIAGSAATAYGRYHVRGPVLKVSWKRYEPPQICVPNVGAKDGSDLQCLLTTQVDLKGQFNFDGMNALLWTTPSAPVLRLVRVEL